MNMDIIGTLTEYTTWKSIGDNELVSEMMQCSADTLLGYMQASIIRTYEYTGSHGIPFQVGENWSYVTTMSLPEYSYEEQQTWNAQVTAIEEITVPAGTFDCYKVVHTSADGTKTEWWSTNGQFNCPVKSIDDATFVGVQTFELTTYAELQLFFGSTRLHVSMIGVCIWWDAGVSILAFSTLHQPTLPGNSACLDWY